MPPWKTQALLPNTKPHAFVAPFDMRWAQIQWIPKFATARLAKGYMVPRCSGQRFSTNAMSDSPLVWSIWFSITVNKTGQSAFCPVKFAVANVAPLLPMRGAGCGSLFHHYLISAIPPRCRSHSNQPAIFFMDQGRLKYRMICLNGPGIKIIPSCCKTVSSMKQQKIILGKELVEEVLSISSKVPVTQCWSSQRTVWKGSWDSMIPWLLVFQFLNSFIKACYLHLVAWLLFEVYPVFIFSNGMSEQGLKKYAKKQKSHMAGT